MFGLKNDEILTCLLLIVVGYTIAKMFSKRCEGFSVGGVRGGVPLCPSNGSKVDACDLHYSNCDNLYTHTIGSESPYSVHTCKKGGVLNAYRCISTGNKCVFPENHDCQENADCESSVCKNGKCAPTPPSPPPSCPPGQEYCRGGDGITKPGCYPICKNGKERAVDCLCLPKCCFNDPDTCPGGPGVCDP